MDRVNVHHRREGHLERSWRRQQGPGVVARKADKKLGHQGKELAVGQSSFPTSWNMGERLHPDQHLDREAKRHLHRH